MGESPSLLSLCAKVIASEIIYGDQQCLQHIYELPLDLIDYLLVYLPPLALQKLHDELTFKRCGGHELMTDSVKDGRKRGRYPNFSMAWKTLFQSRWPDGVKQIQPNDYLTDQGGVPRCESMICDEWQQRYWEAHLQSCLDEAAETALLPSYGGCIGDIMISDHIIKSINYKRHVDHSTDHHHHHQSLLPINRSTDDYSNLSCHCQQFGRYARYLRLKNVLCVAETCDLLRESELQGLVLQGIKSKNHVDGACKLLKQNSETLLYLELIHCRLLPTTLNEICDSLYKVGVHVHGIQYFSVKSSSILEGYSESMPVRLLSFLASGRSLCLLKFCDNHLGSNFAKMIFDALLDSSSTLSTLELSDNYIAGWLSKLHGGLSSSSTSSLGIDRSLSSLRVLNLRGNNLRKDDAEDLKSALAYIPNLQSLDISENLIGDDGIRSLIPYFIEASERNSPLVAIQVENCSLSCIGTSQLLRSLSSLKDPLNTLSIADNILGSDIAAPLANFMGTSRIRVLNIEDIGLGSSGFVELEKAMPEKLELVKINISKNRGGIEAAKVVHKLILQAPELAMVNAGYNFMPAESLAIICAALRLSKGKMEHLDLTGNIQCCKAAQNSMLAEFNFRGKPIFILPSLPASSTYDDDP